MKRGTIVIIIMLTVALSAAAISVVYHYQNQRRALEFWGPATAQLIDRAATVEFLELGEPDESISLVDDGALDAAEPEQDSDAPPVAKAVEFDQVPWIVAQTKDAAGAKGLANLRRALVLDTTFDWSDRGAEDSVEPRWQYAISINDGRNWATVLFDFDSRQVGLTGGRKTVLLDPQANDDFREFFAEQFPASESRNVRQEETEETNGGEGGADDGKNKQDEQD